MTNCTEAAKKARRDYLKEWRNKNKDKVSRYNREYWERRAKKEQQEAARVDTQGAPQEAAPEHDLTTM